MLAKELVFLLVKKINDIWGSVKWLLDIDCGLENYKNSKGKGKKELQNSEQRYTHTKHVFRCLISWEHGYIWMARCQTHPELLPSMEENLRLKTPLRHKEIWDLQKSNAEQFSLAVWLQSSCEDLLKKRAQGRRRLHWRFYWHRFQWEHEALPRFCICRFQVCPFSLFFPLLSPSFHFVLPPLFHLGADPGTWVRGCSPHPYLEKVDFFLIYKIPLHIPKNNFFFFFFNICPFL